MLEAGSWIPVTDSALQGQGLGGSEGADRAGKPGPLPPSSPLASPGHRPCAPSSRSRVLLALALPSLLNYFFFHLNLNCFPGLRKPGRPLPACGSDSIPVLPLSSGLFPWYLPWASGDGGGTVLGPALVDDHLGKRIFCISSLDKDPSKSRALCPSCVFQSCPLLCLRAAPVQSSLSPPRPCPASGRPCSIPSRCVLLGA